MYAKVIAHSKSSVNGKEITTYELEYPRIVHAELMTHRLFSRNAASSRAIPIDKLVDLVKTETAMPSEWGLNQKGMQAKLAHKYPKLCEFVWKTAARSAVLSARLLQKLGLHKQICNRVLEPFQNIKVIVTTTEDDNWFYLRDHKDADPTIAELARMMKDAKVDSTPVELYPGEFHLPYIYRYTSPTGYKYSCVPPSEGKTTPIEEEEFFSLVDAIKISTSCCAQVSYRVLDESLEKALKIYTQLVTMKPVHASPFEHVATPMRSPTLTSGSLNPISMEKGEHIDHNGDFWSGNFKGWYQFRQGIPNNAVWGK